MNVARVETKIDHLKPNMKVLRAIEEIPVASLLSAKADGEFEYLHYNRLGFSFTTHQTYLLNKWGSLRTDFLALNQFAEAMNQTSYTEAELLCECYGRENGYPVNLPTFIHFIKGKPPQLDKVHLGIFDIISLNGQAWNNGVLSSSMLEKYRLLEPFLQTCTHVHVLPHMKAMSRQDIYGFWKIHVHDQHYEGVVGYTMLDTFKCKPFKDLDAVIMGINKKSGYGKGNLFAQHMATSLKLALMTEEGKFVEIGDCASGIDHQLRHTLWKLMDYKVGEDDKTVYVKPFAIINVEYTDLFRGKNKVYELTATGYHETDTMPLIRFRHPRLLRFRPDKSVNPKDLSIQQIPQSYLVEESA